MEGLDEIRARVLDPSGTSVSCRMRGIFALKGLGGPRAVETLGAAMRRDPSVLVKHEAAYCLGQMRDVSALPVLEEALQDEEEDVVVRHESAEALGAIGEARSLEILDLYAADKYPQEIYETCRLAAASIRSSLDAIAFSTTNCGASTIYTSVDPAPAMASPSLPALRKSLCDSSLDLFERYRAMFALRNIGGEEAVAVLCDGMLAEKNSALFRHEVAFVLGQMRHPACVATLREFLEDVSEHEMVRHEAAEALGSVATPECQALLFKFRADPNRVVRESVAVALDIAEYNADDGALHYADTLSVALRLGQSIGQV
jgi:deoxyhypusine monooxygenase